MIKTYETAMKICTEQFYSLLVLPCIVKYKSKLSPLLAYFLFWSMYGPVELVIYITSYCLLLWF